MNIIACVRTLNEERNIPHFCAGYDWADKILIADGGSDDWTKKTARLFPNVWIRDFETRFELEDGTWMNPEPEHINFLLEWAIDEGADWIVFDDADCWPNPALKRDARQILESAWEPSVFLYRLYLWGEDEYFPKYNVKSSIWAWKPDEMVIFWDEHKANNFFQGMIIEVDHDKVLHLSAPPYACLHNFAPDEETIQKKMDRYASWGHPIKHPLESIYAPAEPLPKWVYQ
jgi:glycosyltransferase involved in cell wall biosynthesis